VLRFLAGPAGDRFMADTPIDVVSAGFRGSHLRGHHPEIRLRRRRSHVGGDASSGQSHRRRRCRHVQRRSGRQRGALGPAAGAVRGDDGKVRRRPAGDDAAGAPAAILHRVYRGHARRSRRADQLRHRPRPAGGKSYFSALSRRHRHLRRRRRGSGSRGAGPAVLFRVSAADGQDVRRRGRAGPALRIGQVPRRDHRAGPGPAGPGRGRGPSRLEGHPPGDPSPRGLVRPLRGGADLHDPPPGPTR